MKTYQEKSSQFENPNANIAYDFFTSHYSNGAQQAIFTQYYLDKGLSTEEAEAEGERAATDTDSEPLEPEDQETFYLWLFDQYVPIIKSQMICYTTGGRDHIIIYREGEATPAEIKEQYNKILNKRNLLQASVCEVIESTDY